VRICSLVPAATEALFALGLGDQVVAVTHECDWPPEARTRPAVTTSLLDTTSLPAAEVDRLVAGHARAGKPLYVVEEAVWRDVRADLVVAQEICDVCAVTAGDVRKLDVQVVDYSPTTLDGIPQAIAALAFRLGTSEAGVGVASGLRGRIARVREATAGEPRPRVFVAEWLDPPYVAGHWVPEMVAAAGGLDVAGRVGERSPRTTWEDVAALDPDVLVLAPCGYDLERTLAEAPAELPGRKVVAVDANALVSRPGPRIADGVELLAHVLHPAAWPDPGLPSATLRVEPG
jgi:iron complex transport system substrate-binding protein